MKLSGVVEPGPRENLIRYTEQSQDGFINTVRYDSLSISYIYQENIDPWIFIEHNSVQVVTSTN